MQILPALAEQDFAPFAGGISELQRVVGEYFAPVQGGIFSSPAVGRLMRWIADHHLAAVGQSSWGPTAFAILPSDDQAQRVLSSAKAAGMIQAGLVARVVAGCNRGAVLTREPDSMCRG
jgi:predicted sugar kinase